MMDRGYEHVALGAGPAVRAWAPTEPEALAQVALGVLALAIEPGDVAEVEHRDVRAQGESPEARLVNWVNECVYVHEIEGFAVRRVEVDLINDRVIHGVLHGEELDRVRHRPGRAIRLVSLHGVRIVRDPTRFECTVMIAGELGECL